VAHLVWDWNGTLLDDLTLVVEATNASLALFGGEPTTADAHRREFRRPVSAYYALVLGRALDDAEFGRLDQVFHTAYGDGLRTCALTADAPAALAAWTGTQSLLSMWFHDELVPTVDRYGLSRHFVRSTGCARRSAAAPRPRISSRTSTPSAGRIRMRPDRRLGRRLRRRRGGQRPMRAVRGRVHRCRAALRHRTAGRGYPRRGRPPGPNGPVGLVVSRAGGVCGRR